MAKAISISAEVDAAALNVPVTADPGSAGTAIPYVATTSRVTITNTSGGSDFQFQLNGGTWQTLPRNAGITMPINLAIDVLRTRRDSFSGGIVSAELQCESAPSLSAGGVALPTGRPGATAVILGDSISNQNTQTSATFGAHLAKGYWTQAQIMLEQRFELLNNGGVNGDTTAQMLARIDTAVLAFRPQYCYFMGGTNDVGSDVPYATTIANYTAIFAKLQAAGIALIIATMTPRGFAGMTQARLLNMIALNSWLQNFAARTPGVILIDLYRQMLDHASLTTTSQGEPVAAWFDGAALHPVAAGAVQMGIAIARQLDAVIPRLPRRLHCNYNGTNGDSTNHLRNGMFMAGTGGTAGLNATGTIGQQWTAAATAGAISGACSMVTRAASFNDGFPGNVQRVAITASAVASEIFRFAAFVATPAVGAQIFMEVEVLAFATTGTIAELSITFGTVGGTGVAAAANYMPANTETLAIGTTPYKGVLRTPTITAPVGTVGAYAYIIMRTSAGAVAQVDLANARLTRVN
ncbi:hypothetical protein IV454_16365 [Massilia antarctica]|uniref:SGNH hydrolase-type esterase domain-containing protein n=1 Tax=Massilia antarctica TaxID=2765360 RepID=A0AA48WHN4_9BURK|nr:GDSL-type esterase/lipase family protein [Massilia antarctica]QPI52920.1 hypothetical protein IV454_16365 [Massilia antarctica]